MNWRYALVAAAALVVGALAGYWLGAAVHTRQHFVLVTRELQSLTAIMEAMGKIDAGAPPEALAILEARMKVTIAGLRDLTLIPVHLEDPGLIRAARLARARAESANLTETAAQARLVVERLTPAR